MIRISEAWGSGRVASETNSSGELAFRYAVSNASQMRAGASSSSVSTTTAEAFTSSSTFCVKRLDSAANSALISCIRSFCDSDSRAPARTKST